MVRQMDDLVTGDDGGDLYRLDRNQSFLNQGLDEDISKSKEGDEVEELTHGVSLLADESVHISPGFFQVFRGQAKQAACMIYYSRKDAGTPRISPKAGNMVGHCVVFWGLLVLVLVLVLVGVVCCLLVLDVAVHVPIGVLSPALVCDDGCVLLSGRAGLPACLPAHTRVCLANCSWLII